MISTAPAFLPTKDTLSIIPLSWVLVNTNLLITGATITAIVISGIDPNPTAILNGSLSGIGTQTAMQLVQGGLPGCAYNFKIVITLSDGTRIAHDSYLPVI